MTPTLSEASALIVMVPAAVEPDAGGVMAPVGGGVAGGGAVGGGGPLPVGGVWQETGWGERVSSAPAAAPSSMNWTPATPTLSEARALTVMVAETGEPDEGDVMLTVGGVVSGGGP